MTWGDRLPGSARSLAPVWIVVALYVFCAALFRDDVAGWIDLWRTSRGSSHGFVVAIVVPLMIWARRGGIVLEEGRGAAPLIGFVLATALWVAGVASSTEIVRAVALPAMLWFVCWAVMGRRTAWVLALPLGFLLFALPVIDLATPVLQWFTLRAADFLLAIVGIRAQFAGNLVTVPAGTFEIAAGCAGVHYLVVALAMACLFVFVERMPLRAAAAIATSAVAIALAANWVRVAVIIAIGQWSNMQSPLVRSHYDFGWYVFAVAMVPLTLIARRLASRLPALDPKQATVPSARVATVLVRAALGTGLLVAAWGWGALLEWRAASFPLSPLAPPLLAGWNGPLAPHGQWQPRYAGAASTWAARYKSGADEVDAFVARYTSQSRGRKLVGFLSTVVGGAGWAERATRRVDAPRAIEHEVVGPAGQRRLIWSWYEVGGARLMSDLDVKLGQAAAAFGGTPLSAVVAISSECRGTCDAARGSIARAFDAGLGRISVSTVPPR